jgi:hypothetical protein
MQEEQEARRRRAERFGISKGDGAAGYSYGPEESEEKRRQRAEKFGGEYQPVEAAVMDVGEWHGSV